MIFQRTALSIGVATSFRVRTRYRPSARSHERLRADKRASRRLLCSWGLSEGNIIEASLVLRDGTLFTLAWVKTFGKEDENWMIARALTQVLDSLIYWREVPELVEMDGKLPPGRLVLRSVTY